MDITFFGAARHVTGSCTMVTCNGKNFLVDCGLPQGNDEVADGLGLPFRASDIDAVLLTHAHIDHSGRIPLLVKDGFAGPIYCTTATMDLCSIMLPDSAKIQESDAQWKNRKRERSGEGQVEPLYTSEDAQKALTLFHGLAYDEMIEVLPGVKARFIDAGHLLGSSSIEVWLTEDGQTREVVFSGDIGNFDQPIIKNPEYINTADYVVMESTYGDRMHEHPEGTPTGSHNVPTAVRAKELADIIGSTFKKGGNVIIPSFAVGRAQEILYLIRTILAHKMLPELGDIPVFLDSPLSIKATQIFSENIQGYYDAEAMALVKQGINPIIFPSLVPVSTADESKELNSRRQPCVIISSSGMCEAGRIRHHLKHNLWRRECTILFTGYQAEGTLGRSILEGARHVTIFGEQIEVRARICKLEGISGHADQDGLMKWLKAFKKRPREVFVVHGEDRIATWFAGYITQQLGLSAYAPQSMESYNLLSDKMPSTVPTAYVEPNGSVLSRSINRLDAGKKNLENLIQQLEEFAQQLDSKADVQEIKRMNNAITRLASDIEFLQVKWKKDHEQRE